MITSDQICLSSPIFNSWITPGTLKYHPTDVYTQGDLQDTQESCNTHIGVHRTLRGTQLPSEFETEHFVLVLRARPASQVHKFSCYLIPHTLRLPQLQLTHENHSPTPSPYMLNILILHNHLSHFFIVALSFQFFFPKHFHISFNHILLNFCFGMSSHPHSLNFISH